jgi:hypothetical protein
MDRRAHLAVDLSGGLGEALVGALGGYPEGLERALLQRHHHLGLQALEIERGLVGAREVRHAEHRSDALARQVPPRAVRDLDGDPPRQAAHARPRDVPGGAAQVVGQLAQEEGTVAALERDLVVVDEDYQSSFS